MAVAAMGCDVDDPAELLAAAELALDRARRSVTSTWRPRPWPTPGWPTSRPAASAEGMALLDEAMALACGPADDIDTAAKSVCSFFTACYFAGDFERAGSWTSLLRRQGLISLAPGRPGVPVQPLRQRPGHVAGGAGTLDGGRGGAAAGPPPTSRR